MKKNYSSIIISLVCAITLVSCVHQRVAPANLKPAKPFEIEFLVAGPNLNLFTGNQGCKKADKGCVRIPSANSGEITFKFQNNQNYPCTGNPNSHYVTSIKLSDFPKDFDQSVSDWIQEDFGADADTGVVWNHTPGSPQDSVTIVDENEHKGVAYYQIEVAACSDGSTLTNDPRFENEG